MRCEVCHVDRRATALYLWKPYLDKARGRRSVWTPICTFCIMDFSQSLARHAMIIKQREDT